jgi:exodeoxyribonuclease VII large subunit
LNPLTVSALTTHIVALIERDELLREVAVTGEISNWRRAVSGHIYFSLKDSGSAITSVMWRGNAAGQNWLPQEGDQVIAQGYVGVYAERGVYQLYVNRMQPAGRGELYARFEALKERLTQEGLFNQERKRPISPQPRRLAVVTSADAAALRDILRVLAARWPLVDIIVFPTLVQGSEAPLQIVEAIRAANGYHEAVEPIDTLILARGGGSIEDLWAFNDERVAYAVGSSEIPVIAGVGHETDFTIVDFVADLRASTPSAAASAATPDRAEIHQRLEANLRWMAQQVMLRLSQDRRDIRQRMTQLRRLHPQRQLDQWRQRLDDRERRLHAAMNRRRSTLVESVWAQASRLQALSPLHVLERGYSIVQTEDGMVVLGPDQVEAGRRLSVRAARGSYHVEVAVQRPSLHDVKE